MNALTEKRKGRIINQVEHMLKAGKAQPTPIVITLAAVAKLREKCDSNTQEGHWLAKEVLSSLLFALNANKVTIVDGNFVWSHSEDLDLKLGTSTGYRVDRDSIPVWFVSCR